MTDAVAVWDRLLDRLDAELRAARTAFEQSGDINLAGFAPPRALPPLPAACVARATRLADEQAAFEAIVQTRLTAVAGELAAHSTASHTTAHAASSARHGARFETRV